MRILAILIIFNHCCCNVYFSRIVMTSHDSNIKLVAKKIKPTKKQSKEPKIKYSKEFLKRVKGIDLDLKKSR
jgi:hypothetical protein